MIKKIAYIFSAFLLLIACGKEEKPEYVRTPVIEISFENFYKDGVNISFRSINTDAVYALALEVDEPAPSAQEIAENGVKAEGNKLFVGGLEKEKEYTIYGVG